MTDERCPVCDRVKATNHEWQEAYRVIREMGDSLTRETMPHDNKCYGEIMFYGQQQGCMRPPVDWRDRCRRALDLLEVNDDCGSEEQCGCLDCALRAILRGEDRP